MKTFRDIFGWFPEESVAALTQLIEENNVKTVAEVGSFLGRSTAFFASKVDKVTAVDPFKRWQDKDRANGDIEKYSDEDFFQQFEKNMEDCGVLDKIFVLRMSSNAADLALDENYKPDLVYIDGLHDYDSVFNDILTWDKRATKVICGDDYDENWRGVKGAVKEIFGDQFQVKGRIWYVIK